MSDEHDPTLNVMNEDGTVARSYVLVSGPDGLDAAFAALLNAPAAQPDDELGEEISDEDWNGHIDLMAHIEATLVHAAAQIPEERRLEADVVQRAVPLVKEFEGDIDAALQAEGMGLAELVAYGLHASIGLDELHGQVHEIGARYNDIADLLGYVRRSFVSMAMEVMHWRSMALTLSLFEARRLIEERGAMMADIADVDDSTSPTVMVEALVGALAKDPRLTALTSNLLMNELDPSVVLPATTLAALIHALSHPNHIGCSHDLSGRFGDTIARGDWIGAGEAHDTILARTQAIMVEAGLTPEQAASMPTAATGLSFHWEHLASIPGMRELYRMSDENPFPSDAAAWLHTAPLDDVE